MRIKGPNLLALLLICLCFVNGTAQTYPASLSTQLTGPRSIFLDEYSDPFKPRIKTTIFFTDFTVPSWQFALKLKITGPNGILIFTSPNAKPAIPVAVAPGQPYELSGADLAFYFNYNNLIFTGITRSQLELNHRLPEGLYTFCFEAIDYESGRSLSHPACVSAYLALNDPPLVVSPQNGSVIENISMQNILMQWQLSNAHANIDLNHISYQINLYEVNNNWVNPATAIINNQALPIWQSFPQKQNTYIYGPAEPPLEKGKRYVFTVKATEDNGRGSFKNDGVSMPVHFRYGYAENDTILLQAPVQDFQFTLSTPSQFIWKKPQKAMPGQMVIYTMRLVEVLESQTPDAAILNNSPFFQQTFLATSNPLINKTIPVAIWANIKRMGKYAWQVTAQSGMQEIAKSEVRTFTGPPEIEFFIAGGFLMEVTRLDLFNKTDNIISGRCRTKLRSDSVEKTEFAFQNIKISPIGSNEWVMSDGLISDKITASDYTFQPQTIADNKEAWFSADSIYVNTSGLKLAGILRWKLPHLGVSGQEEMLLTKRCKLSLANISFLFNGSAPVSLDKNYQIVLLDPYNFKLRINQSSNFSVYQNTYETSFNGFVQMPSNVMTTASTAANISFSQTKQLFYIAQQNREDCESIRLAANTAFELLPVDYVIDLSEKDSPGEFSTDTEWKGVHVSRALFSVPVAAEGSGQITMSLAKNYTISNSTSDTNQLHITHRGLFLRSTIVLEHADSLKFNGFPTKSGYFYSNISESEMIRTFISGNINIPVIDTATVFPYYIEMGDFGFNEGYLLNGLANTTFTFNAAGSAEQRIMVSIKRALFRNRNRLEMDLDLHWPYFNLQLNGVNRFSAWGNGNIGFDVPNGKHALSYQAQGKASNFDITVDHIGCGRNGNVYAFGASANINMDEEISGETGPPVINAYSIYRNPLLTGTLSVPLSSLQSSVSSSTITTSASSSSQLGGSAAGYSSAISAGMNDVLGEFGFNGSDTITLNMSNDKNVRPLISGNVVTQVQQALDIIFKLKPFIVEGGISDRDWEVLYRFQRALSNDLVQQAQITNARGLLDFVLNKVVEGLITRINSRIEEVGQLAVGKVRGAINSRIADPINNKIDKALGSVFTKLQQKALLGVEDKYHEAVISTFSITKASLSNAIRNAVQNSFENNITAKLDRTIQLCVISKVTGFVRKEVSAAGQELIGSGVNAQIDLQQIWQNGGSMFADVADTVRDVVMQLNAHNFVNTAESLVEDAINGIDWDAVAAEILNGLIAKSIPQAIAAALSDNLAQAAGPYAAAVLSTVKFDFSNLGEKLQNGQLDQIVKFDPTNIYIQSPAVDIRGTLIFKKDDPVYGDSWQADVLVRVKVPKKDNPIECTAFFLNGKTSGANGEFTYWMAKLGVSGLNIPLTPAPLVWDAADGYAYSKMKKLAAQTVLPDHTNKFGLGCSFTFFDQQSSGASMILALGAEAEFNDGGFYIELNGNASMMNFQKLNGKYKSPGFVTGTGSIGYYKTPEVSKVAGNFDVQLHTQPLLCAGGNAGFDLRGSNNWKVWVGTQESPFAVKLLCKDFLQNTAYLQVGNSGFSAGLSCNVDVNARSPWIQCSGIKVRGFASFGFGYNVVTSIEWEPAFKITEATVSAWVSAALGIDYETLGASSSLTLAGVSLAGTLSYKSQPESELHGALSGNITVVGFSVGFDTEVHYSLSQQKILD